MCLRIVHDGKSNRKTGYKLLYPRTHGGFETGCVGVGKVQVGTERYITDPNTDPIVGYDPDGIRYPAGFHIFLSREVAKKVQRLIRSRPTLCKVRFKDEVAYGKVRWYFREKGCKPFYASTVVARRCMIVAIIK